MGHKGTVVAMLVILFVAGFFIWSSGQTGNLEAAQLTPDEMTLQAAELEQKINMLAFSYTMRKVIQTAFVLFLIAMFAAVFRLVWSLGKRCDDVVKIDTGQALDSKIAEAVARNQERFNLVDDELKMEIIDKLEERVIDAE